MLTEREKVLVDMLRVLAEELRDYRETGVISSDVYAYTAYAVAEMESDVDIDREIKAALKS